MNTTTLLKIMNKQKYNKKINWKEKILLSNIDYKIYENKIYRTIPLTSGTGGAGLCLCKNGYMLLGYDSYRKSYTFLGGKLDEVDIIEYDNIKKYDTVNTAIREFTEEGLKGHSYLLEKNILKNNIIKNNIMLKYDNSYNLFFAHNIINFSFITDFKNLNNDKKECNEMDHLYWIDLEKLLLNIDDKNLFYYNEYEYYYIKYNYINPITLIKYEYIQLSSFTCSILQIIKLCPNFLKNILNISYNIYL